MKMICPKAGTCIRLPCRKAELHSNCNCHSIDMNCGFPDCPPCIEVSEQENMSCPDNGGNCPVNDANKCLTCPEQKPEKQMREKIAGIIDNAIMADQTDGRFSSLTYADQILSLFNAKSEEEVKAEERKKMIDEGYVQIPDGYRLTCRPLQEA